MHAILTQFKLVEAANLQSTLYKQEIARLFDVDRPNLLKINQTLKGQKMTDKDIYTIIGDSILWRVA